MLDFILLDSAGWATEFFNWFCENANYWFVFIFMVIESSFIPFPSELVVPPATYLALQTNTEMNIYIVVLIATAGALVGAYVNYYLALWLGRPIIYRFVDSRLGHILLLDKTKVEQAEQYFDKKGAFDISKCNLIAYANGGYYTLGKKVGKFGYSVQKKKKRR